MSDNLDDSRRYTYQTSVVCDGCEGIRDVHYFCLDCPGNICNACKERHPNVRLTKNHTVLPRGHPAVIELRLAKTKRKISCRKHTDNDYVTYCIKCNTPCCSKCMIEDHAGHVVTKFDVVEEDVRQALTKYGETLEKELLPQALKITTELKERKSTSTEQLQKHKDQVRRRVSDLQKKVADVGREAEDKLDEMYNTEVETLDDLIRTSEGKSKLMSELVANCKQTVDKANAVEMSLQLSDCPTDLAALLPKITLPHSTVFSITTELKQRKSTPTKQFQKHKDQVRRRVSDLQNKVADLGKEAEDKLDEMYRTEVETLDDLIRTSEEKSKMISELIDNCKQNLDSANAVEMSLLLSDSPADLANILPKVILPPSTIFTESSFEIHDYNEVVGEVKGEEKRKNLFDPVSSDVKLLKPEVKIELAVPDCVESSSPPEPESFTHDMIQISKEGQFSTSFKPYNMARTDNDEVWIKSGRKLILYDEAGNQKQTMAMTFCIDDISLTASQDIIATDYTNNRIVRIPRSGDFMSLCSTSPLTPCGICINDRQQLVVALRKGLYTEAIKLTVYSSDGGSVVQEMEKDKALFNGYIHRVRQNGNGDYVVIDGNTLVCLTRDGSLRWRHGGWSVTGVECDRYCNVIYCDDDGVTMLDRDGGLIRQLLTSVKDGVVYPRSISLDTQGRLWIGLWGKTVQIWKYLK